MSLLLHEDHRAWQQRISKEIFTASRANEFFSHYSTTNSFRPRSSSQLKRSQHKSKRSKKTQNTTLNKDKTRFTMSFGMYAEVRGKYARPAPQLNKGIVNPILKRPNTAFSLRPRSANGERNEKKEKFDPFLEYLEKSFRVEERHSTAMPGGNKESIIKKRRVSEGNNFEKKIEGKIGKLEEKIGSVKGILGNTEERRENTEKIRDSIEGNPNTEEKTEKKNEDAQISNEDVKNSLIINQEDQKKPNAIIKNEASRKEKKNAMKDSNVVNKKSKNLGIKSSSSVSSARKKYIEELEKSLREEKLKRMKLEEILNSID